MKTAIIALAFILLLLISGCAKKTEVIHTSLDNTEDIKNEAGQKVGELNVKIKADVEVSTDCGDMSCFEEKFKECKPATLTSKLGADFPIVYYYEIIGPKDGRCEVKSKFMANPNPTWIGKEMVCKYDNTKSFNTAVRDISQCSGELYNLMIGA